VTHHTFTVIGSPVAQARPRFARIGGFVRAYDPASSKSWKNDVKAQVLQALGGLPEIHEGALQVSMVFRLQRPKTLPKKITHHTRKPDTDNLGKAVKDALRGVLYKDDSQIVRLAIRKEYADAYPHVVIEMEEVA